MSMLNELIRFLLKEFDTFFKKCGQVHNSVLRQTFVQWPKPLVVAHAWSRSKEIKKRRNLGVGINLLKFPDARLNKNDQEKDSKTKTHKPKDNSDLYQKGKNMLVKIYLGFLALIKFR